jgi:hypothetical protein
MKARLRRYVADALIDLHDIRADRHALLAARHRHAARKLRADNLTPAQRLDQHLRHLSVGARAYARPVTDTGNHDTSERWL